MLWTIFPRSSPSSSSRWPTHQRISSKTFVVEEGDLEPRHHQSLQPRASLLVQGLGGADAVNAYLQIVDWLQGANNGGPLFIMGMADICMGRPYGVTLLTRAEQEGDIQVSYVLSVLKYYKHGATNDVFNHIWHIYGEDRDYYENDARVLGVHHRVFEEIDHVRWRKHINHDHDHIHEIQMPEDSH
jgi:hypothetical protein